MKESNRPLSFWKWSDRYVWNGCDEFIKAGGIKVLEYSELDTVDIDEIITLAFAMPNKTQAVISIGGGKVIDAGNMRHFYAIFHLSVCRLPVRVMDFPVRVHPFLSTESALRFQHGLLTALLWNTGHKNCTGEVYLFRDRRYDLKDHSTL